MTVLTSVGCLALTVACLDFKRSNPFDPEVPVTTRITPETLFSIGGPTQFAFATTPPVTDTFALWFGSAPDLKTAPQGSGGVFYSFGAPLWPQTETITMAIAIGRHDVNRVTSFSRGFTGSVVVTQRLVRIHARCGGTPACGALTVGASASLFVDGFDALGSQISGVRDSTTNPTGISPAFTFTVRDTTIASAAAVGQRVATVTANKTGSTWIVAQRDVLRDSVQVVVR